MIKKLLTIPRAIWEQRYFLLTFCAVQIAMIKLEKWLGW